MAPGNTKTGSHGNSLRRQEVEKRPPRTGLMLCPLSYRTCEGTTRTRTGNPQILNVVPPAFAADLPRWRQRLARESGLRGRGDHTMYSRRHSPAMTGRGPTRIGENICQDVIPPAFGPLLNCHRLNTRDPAAYWANACFGVSAYAGAFSEFNVSACGIIASRKLAKSVLSAIVSFLLT